MQVMNKNQYTRSSAKTIKLRSLFQCPTKLDLAISLVIVHFNIKDTLDESFNLIDIIMYS